MTIVTCAVTVAVRSGMPSPGQLSAEFRRQRVAGVNTRENADQGDADLYGREEPVGVFGQFQGLAGACAALPGLHLQIRAAGRYERDLRHGEQPLSRISSRMTRISMECLVGLCRKDNGCRAKTKEYGPEGIAYSLKNAKFAGKIYWI